MSDSIESLLRQMSLKQPSDELDRRIADLIVSHQLDLKSLKHEHRRQRWIVLAATAVSFMFVGLAIGYVIAGQRSHASGDAIADQTSLGNSASSSDNGSGSSGETETADSDSGTASDSEPMPARTRFMNERYVRTDDGSFRKTYQTMTPKQFLLFDAETKSFYNLEIDIPRIVVTSPPEI